MRTFLYAEDSDDDVFFMHRAMKKASIEARLSVVKNGQEAIEYLTGQESYQDRQSNPFPNLVFLDLSMPIRNGFEVLEWIRSHSSSPDLPVMILTSSNNKGDRERAEALGATEYLVKPGQPEKLTDLLLFCQKYWL